MVYLVAGEWGSEGFMDRDFDFKHLELMDAEAFYCKQLQGRTNYL